MSEAQMIVTEKDEKVNFAQIDFSFSLFSAIHKQPPCPNPYGECDRWSKNPEHTGVFGLVQPENISSTFKEEENYYSNVELQFCKISKEKGKENEWLCIQSQKSDNRITLV
jgi:hypothetical protein